MSTSRRIALLVVMALAIALGVVLVYTLSPSGQDGLAARPTPPSVATGAGTSGPTPPSTSSGTTAPGLTTSRTSTATPQARVTTRAAGTGPGLTELGIHVLAQPQADGGLEVVEDILLARPVSILGLAPPPTPAYPGLEGLTPEVVDLQAESRGVPVAVALAHPLRTRQDLRFGLTTAISLRYRLEDASHRSEPSPLGRALMVLPAISAGDYPDLPVVIEVTGPGVRNVLCPRLTGDAQLCAVQAGGRWTTADLTGRPVSVIAQVDLPAPG